LKWGFGCPSSVCKVDGHLRLEAAEIQIWQLSQRREGWMSAVALQG
jgi:hypothetical protein